MPHEEDLDDDDRLTRDVYAHFGVAIYLAQVLEKAVLTAVVLTQALTSAEWTAQGFQLEWDARWAKAEKLPLGPLLKKFDQSVHPRPDLLSALRDALATRNHLAHYYFWEHADDAFSVLGREAMIDELLSIHRRLEDLNEQVTKLTFGVVATVGATTGQLADRIAALEAATRAKVRVRDEEGGKRGSGGDSDSCGEVVDGETQA